MEKVDTRVSAQNSSMKKPESALYSALLYGKPLPPLPTESLSSGDNLQDTIPAFDKAHGTRNFCIAGLVFSWGIAVVCIALVPWTFRSGRTFPAQNGGYTADGQGEHIFFLSARNQELIKLAVNVCITLCTDCLGYIHSTSLRWALKREKELHFNSYLRLAASTRSCSSNRWSTNVVSAILLMACYAASGQLFLSNDSATEKNFVLNGIAVAALGIGILGQALISTVSLLQATKLIPTWSSNPLNTVLVCMHYGMRHRKNRCMLSVRDADNPGDPILPSLCQSSMRHAIPCIGRILYFVWTLFVVTLIWSVSVILESQSRKQSSGLAAAISFYGNGLSQLQLNLYGLLITISFQMWLTLGLHCTELIVNISRDESTWRRATTTSGTRISYGPLGSIKAAALSWQTLLLFGLKSLTHWLFGISLNSTGGVMLMNWQGVYLLSAAILVLALFATLEANWRPRGPQPATFGHLQTLADLIDEWAEEDEIMWWGDKGTMKTSLAKACEIRHAGTAKKKLKCLRRSFLYA